MKQNQNDTYKDEKKYRQRRIRARIIRRSKITGKRMLRKENIGKKYFWRGNIRRRNRLKFEKCICEKRELELEKECKATPLTGREGPWSCETSRLSHFQDNRLTKLRADVSYNNRK
jgi:hypothetical protein